MDTESGYGDLSVTEGSQIFTWKLCNISDRMVDTSGSIDSTKFSVKDSYNWTSDCVLKIYFHKSTNEKRFSVGIYNIGDTPLILGYNVGIQDKIRNVTYVNIVKTCVIYKSRDCGIVKNYPVTNFERDVSLVLLDENFTLVITLTKPLVQCPTNGCTLPGDIKDYLDDEMADVKIRCNGKVFGCHRFILALNSPVFEAMLKSNFKESTRGEIILDSTEPAILEVRTTLIYIILKSYLSSGLLLFMILFCK